MRLAQTLAQTLELLTMAPYLAPLLGQGGALSRDLVLSRHTDSQHLLGFLSRRRPTQGRQAKGDASRILRLAHSMALGHPEERFDGIGADWQADLIESYSLGGGELIRQRGLKLLAHQGRGYLADQRLTLGQGVVGESLRLENLLALQQALGIGSEALDEVLARRQLIHARP